MLLVADVSTDNAPDSSSRSGAPGKRKRASSKAGLDTPDMLDQTLCFGDNDAGLSARATPAWARTPVKRNASHGSEEFDYWIWVSFSSLPVIASLVCKTWEGVCCRTRSRLGLW